jgi:hypothetical protein
VSTQAPVSTRPIARGGPGRHSADAELSSLPDAVPERRVRRTHLPPLQGNKCVADSGSPAPVAAARPDRPGHGLTFGPTAKPSGGRVTRLNILHTTTYRYRQPVTLFPTG